MGNTWAHHNALHTIINHYSSNQNLTHGVKERSQTMATWTMCNTYTFE
jgi:hypothetical protein